ncbi:hypothetical protein MKW92_017460 [Papaver armeniacum]|nr:hypothetical protein MKW92_017460 [Papaver armeniacum]
MVDAVVAIAVKKLSDVLIGETVFLHGAHRQVEGLRDELIRMQCFLKDADGKEQGDERVRNWVMEIRHISYDVEDIIDTFILKVGFSRKTKGFRNLVIKKALMVKNLIHLHRVHKEILTIQSRLKAISDSTITYGIKELWNNQASSSERNQKMMQLAQRNRYVHVEDTDVIGFDENIKRLLVELMKDEEGRCVISVVGVGGLGKTTLAKKIYMHDTISSHFDCCGWSSISQQLNVKDSLEEIVKKCMTPSENDFLKIKKLNERDLIEKIYTFLQDKRYFIVLDDVWKSDHWNSLSPAFPIGKRGSKILLTTRNGEVASQIDPWSFHFQPQFLTDEESWELLSKKAFPKNMVHVGCYPAGLEKLGREMVLKCGGLPLAICMLGVLLATKGSDIRQWEVVHADVISQINKGENVLDDVWKSYHWNSLSPAFPIGKRGSKVLLTTRNGEVASQIDPWSLHFQPQFLTDEESWELLSKKAFPRNMVPVADLEKLGREMVRKCGGLPLAICVLGGLLATKGSEIRQWETVRADVISHINKGENGGVNGILALSYHDLPSPLKPCFLYLGHFPEDYAIPKKKLIRLWIAEGFIPHTQENSPVTMEDIAEHQYLKELTERCIIQLGKGDTPDGPKSVCRVHDLVRDLCLSKVKENNFLNIYNMQRNPNTGDIQASFLVSADACPKVRRYAINLHANTSKYRYAICFDTSDSAIRTFLVFVWHHSDAFPFSLINYQHIKLLRVLDLTKVGNYETDVTKEVSQLIHLRYLDLGDMCGTSVSPSLGDLQNLQTLRLNRYEGELPQTISKLVQLRHLGLLFGETHEKFGIENLINLQSICGIIPGNWIRKGCLEKLLNFRKLSTNYASQLQVEILVDELVGKRRSLSASSSSSSNDQYQIPIRSLRIEADIGHRFPNSIFDSLSCCHNLNNLGLFGSLDIINLPKYPPNLTKLHLSGSSFTEDPMATLQYLPKLRKLILSLVKYGGEEMACSSRGFPQLQYLSLSWFRLIKEWRVEQGGMPNLKELDIDHFSKLSMLPEGLRFITTLENLKIKNMPLVEERVVEGGDDWYKVQHIPSISINQFNPDEEFSDDDEDDNNDESL